MSDTEWAIIRMAISIAVFGLICMIFPKPIMRVSHFFRPWVSKEEGMKNPHLLRLCGFIMIIMVVAIVIYVKFAWL